MIKNPMITGGKKLPTLTNPGTAADLRAGKQLIDAEGNPLTGTMPELEAQTITPGASDQIIQAGQYLAGALTIKAESIKAVGYEVTGSMEMVGSKLAYTFTFPSAVTEILAFLAVFGQNERIELYDGTWYFSIGETYSAEGTASISGSTLTISVAYDSSKMQGYTTMVGLAAAYK